MISEAFQAIEFLLKLYNNKAQRSQLERHLKRALLRELALNKELVSQAGKAKAQDPQVCKGLIEATKAEAFAAISNLGLPLEEMLNKKWEVVEAYPVIEPNEKPRRKKFLSRTRLIRTEVDLIERTYHRLIVQKIRAEINEEQNSESLNYLAHLLYESVEMLRDKVGVSTVQQS